jgi:hypothetical protein
MQKKISELKRGDIVKTEYGDYDNWVVVIVNYVEKEKEDYKINCQLYPDMSEPFDMYSFNVEYVEVLNEK